VASSLVPLNSGHYGQPIFIAAGGGGDVRNYGNLVAHMRIPYPIYGMQSTGIDDGNEPCEHIENIAQLHIDAVQQIQPHGPYFLIGYSFGGLVALEMAQRFLKKGAKVALLVMIEAYPYRRFLPLSLRLRQYLRLCKRHISMLSELSIREALPHVGIPLFARRLIFAGNGNGESHETNHQSRSDAEHMAWMNYRPCRYAGVINFVAGESSFELPNAVPYWSKLAEGFVVETTHGDHLGIMGEHAEEVASVLSRYIAEVLPQSSVREENSDFPCRAHGDSTERRSNQK